MKYWDRILTKNLSWTNAKIILEQVELRGYIKKFAITREEWDGFHFYNKEGVYSILFKDGHIEKDMEDKSWNKNSNDWIIVSINKEAENIICNYNKGEK